MNVTLRAPTPPTQTHDTSGMKHILVVDDDQDFLMTYKEMLEANDFMVTTAANGVEGLKAVMHLDVDAVFCDMNMPTMAGDMFYTAVQRVKPHICERFVFVTGYEGNFKYEEFFKKIKATVLYKPVTLGKLLGTAKIIFARTSTAKRA
jgi:CheY-like chemotaxis protein